MRLERHLKVKYPAWLLQAVLLLCACAAPSPPPAGRPSPVAESIPGPGPSPTLATVVPVLGLRTDRLWYTAPDGLFQDRPRVIAEFAGDPTAGAPRLRIEPLGREVPLSRDGPAERWSTTLDLAGIAPGRYKLGVVERVAGVDDTVDGSIGGSELVVSAPEYVVWTLDFEGDESADAELANTAAIADGMKVPMTILWNPRVWSTDQVRPSRAEAMLAWTKDRLARGDEVGLHLHGWTDWVRAAGLTARTTPSWAGRSDGYDVPLTAYTEEETRTMLDFALRQMADHGLPRPTSFRAGGQFATAATLRALVAARFTADCSAVPGTRFGALALPWPSLAAGAQPYRPSREDATVAGDLPLLESPTIGGNTYAHTVSTIQPIIRADLAMLAPRGELATVRRALNLVSHPGTIVPAERAAIEALFRALAPLRYDTDAGPLRFLTLRQLVEAYR